MARTMLLVLFSLVPCVLTFSINGAVKTIPNIFGIAKYMPEVGQEQLADIVVKNLFSVLLSKPGAFINNDAELPKLDLDIPNVGRFVLDDGQIHGLLSYVQYPMESVRDTNDLKEITIRLHFTNLYVTYKNLTLETWGIKLNNCGNVTLTFNSNLLITKIAVVKYFEVAERLVKNECICYLTSLNITELGDVVVVFSLYGARSNGVHNRVLAGTLRYLKDAVTLNLNYALIKYTYDILPFDDSWICKDKRLQKFLLQVDSEEAAAKLLAEENRKKSWGDSVKSLFS